MPIDPFSNHALMNSYDEEYREEFVKLYGKQPRWVPTGWNEELKRTWARNYKAKVDS